MAHDTLEHFLMYPLYRSGGHPNQPNWDKFVYDIEELHYGLLSMFFKQSAGFATEILKLPAKAKAESVMPPYSNHPFDLEVSVSSALYYVEVKTWADLDSSQVRRQTDHLRKHGAKGVYLLTSFQKWTAEQIAKETGSLAHLVLFAQVADSLQSNLKDLKSPTKEIAQSYISALRDLVRRTQGTA